MYLYCYFIKLTNIKILFVSLYEKDINTIITINYAEINKHLYSR
jgi:hypothetical protein